jgi:transcriptional regulator with XRE-family HTH domain
MAICENRSHTGFMGTQSALAHRFAMRMRKVRNYRGMTGQELANRTGIHSTALVRIETGGRGISLDDAVAICDALDVPLEAMCSPEPLRLTLETRID